MDWSIPNFDDLLASLTQGEFVAAPDDGGVLLPHELTATLAPGQSVTERKTASLPETPPKGDVLFAIIDGKKPRLLITHRKDMASLFIVGPDGKPRFSAGMVRGRK